MAVDFPVGAGKPIVPSLAPIVNGVVRRAQPAIRTKVRNRCDCAGGRRGAHEIILFRKRTAHFYTDLEPNRPIPVDRDVPATSELLSLQRVPDEAAALRDQPAHLVSACLASNDS